MKALILETSSEKSLIALAIDGAPIAVQTLSGGPQLSKNLALEVKNLLYRAQDFVNFDSSNETDPSRIGKDNEEGRFRIGASSQNAQNLTARGMPKGALQPDCIAVGTGPGSYTGIRVGAALAKALAFGWQIPIFGFCSLVAFAPDASQWAVLADARTGGFYTLDSSHDAPRLLSPSEAEVAFQHTPVLASPYPDLIRKRLALPGKWLETSPDPRLLSALTRKLFLEGHSTSLNLSYLTSP